MPEIPLPLSPEDVRLLTEIGFLASAKGDVQRAEAIFGALALVRPTKAFAHLGKAVALMNAGRSKDASTYLGSVSVSPGPEADIVGAMQGLALQLCGEAGHSRRVLRTVVEQSVSEKEPSDGVRLARQLLGDDSPPTLPTQHR